MSASNVVSSVGRVEGLAVIRSYYTVASELSDSAKILVVRSRQVRTSERYSFLVTRMALIRSEPVRRSATRATASGVSVFRAWLLTMFGTIFWVIRHATLDF